jgi:SAM-dependent methyltransferase
MPTGRPDQRGTRVDYDVVAPDYDRRYRAGGPAELAAFVRARAREAAGRPALEVGCGTGRWLAEAASAGAAAIGLDPSTEMLARARERVPAVPLLRARGEAIPLAPASCGAVLAVYAVHHLDEPARFVAEAARVLHPGGRLAVVGLAPHDGLDRWYVYDLFAGTRAADLERYPRTSAIAEWMTAAGLVDVRCGVAARLGETARGAAVFEDPILFRHGTCQLSLLTDEEFARGMEAVRAAARDPEALFTTDLRLFATTARKP